jgi:hypothetical protein
MKKLITLFLLCFALKLSFAQTQRKLSLYLQGQTTHTLKDITRTNNSLGIGLGLQTYFQHSSAFRSTIDLTASIFGGTKEQYLYEDGTPITSVEGMLNVFAGGSYHPARALYLSLVAGPGFSDAGTRFGIKPSLGFYFSSRQKVTGKVSFLHIFNRDERTKEDFSAISFSLGVRLYSRQLEKKKAE